MWKVLEVEVLDVEVLDVEVLDVDVGVLVVELTHMKSLNHWLCAFGNHRPALRLWGFCFFQSLPLLRRQLLANF